MGPLFLGAWNYGVQLPCVKPRNRSRRSDSTALEDERWMASPVHEWSLHLGFTKVDPVHI